MDWIQLFFYLPKPKIHCYCFITERGCFNTYPMHCVKHKAVKCLQILTKLNSSGRSIWCQAGDMFWPKKVSYRPMYIILIPTSLNSVHEMIIERLKTYTVSLESSDKTKIMIIGAKFGCFDVQLGLFLGLTVFRVNISINNHTLYYNMLICNYCVL